MAQPVICLAMIASLALVGCNRSDICSPVTSEKEAADTYLKNIDGKPLPERRSSREAYLDFCVNKWAYILGKNGRATESLTADAVMGACQSALEHLNDSDQRATLEEAKSLPGLPSDTRESGITSQPVPLAVANREKYRERALFYVVQARAGHCDVPM